jgi:hypothetical protein
MIAATATGSDWNAGGSIMTFFAPVGLFVVVAVILFLLFSRPHRRIPARRALTPVHAGVESSVEPAGAALAPGADGVSGLGGNQDNAGQPGRETSATDGTDAGE